MVCVTDADACSPESADYNLCQLQGLRGGFRGMGLLKNTSNDVLFTPGVLAACWLGCPTANPYRCGSCGRAPELPSSTSLHRTARQLRMRTRVMASRP